jgi:hypothetical protein
MALGRLQGQELRAWEGAGVAVLEEPCRLSLIHSTTS